MEIIGKMSDEELLKDLKYYPSKKSQLCILNELSGGNFNDFLRDYNTNYSTK